MEKKIFYGIAVLFFVLTIPAFAQSETPLIIIQTDDNNYDEGDTIVISGQVSTKITGEEIAIQIFYQANMVTIAQIEPAQDGSYTHTILAEPPLWVNEGEYLARAYYAGKISETIFTFSPKKEVIQTTNVYEVDAGSSGTFDVEYTIKGATIKEIYINPENFSLKIAIETTDEGEISLEIPREFLDAKKQNEEDETFIILINDVEVSYKESSTNSKTRTITINFEQDDSEIEIIGTFVVPEFGSITLAILLIGIFTIIIMTRNRFLTRIQV